MIKYHTDLIQGSKFGRLSFLNDTEEKTPDGHIISLWKCECGNNARKAKSRVINNIIKSCGCLGREVQKTHSRTHGMRGSKEYNTWAQIKGRCHNPRNKDFPKYGAKGITVCEKWRESFITFYEHMGNSPTPEYQIDRIDTKGNYEPGNCRWATPKQQARNTVSSYDWYIKGIHFETAKEAGNYFNITEQSIHRWVKGFIDRKGGYYPPKNNCHMISRY